MHILGNDKVSKNKIKRMVRIGLKNEVSSLIVFKWINKQIRTFITQLFLLSMPNQYMITL